MRISASNLQASPMRSTPALEFQSHKLLTPLQSKCGAIIDHDYMTKEAIRYKLREQVVGDKKAEGWRRKWWHHSPTQLSLGRSEPLDGRMGSIHGTSKEIIGYSHRWSSLTGPHFQETPPHPQKASWHHFLPSKSGGANLQGKKPILIACVCKSIHFTVAKWLLVAWKKKVFVNWRMSSRERLSFTFMKTLRDFKMVYQGTIPCHREPMHMRTWLLLSCQ